ncbi:Outer membrane protein assembly factor BamE [Pseudomonas sp. IT-P258]|uniref:OmpA family protein n=1 Tax=Pseudomonas sp. IT-P258 TaxID=3026447 RepID=UPI0039E008F4
MYKQFSVGGLRLAIAVTTMAALTACGTVSKVDDAGQSAQPIYPAIKDASMPEGYYVNLENLGKMRPGMSKKQVMELVSHPQFSEGMFGVREWDYIFKFRQPNGQPDKICQYKVLFDKNMVAQSFFFLPADCMQPPAPAQQMTTAATNVKKINLAADATFGFNSALLRSEGRVKLDQLISELNEAKLISISIIGYTDRFGSPTYNNNLSLQRANSVRSYLMERGVKGSQIEVDGRGSAEPLVVCPGPKSPQVVSCLAPNRRTQITIQFE